MEEAYYLLENRNRFEEPLKARTKRELEALKIALEKKEFLSNHSNHTDKEKQFTRGKRRRNFNGLNVSLLQILALTTARARDDFSRWSDCNITGSRSFEIDSGNLGVPLQGGYYPLMERR